MRQACNQQRGCRAPVPHGFHRLVEIIVNSTLPDALEQTSAQRRVPMPFDRRDHRQCALALGTDSNYLPRNARFIRRLRALRALVVGRQCQRQCHNHDHCQHACHSYPDCFRCIGHCLQLAPAAQHWRWCPCGIAFHILFY